MLHKISESEYNEYLDYIYDLSADLSRSSFPIYADGVKTKEFFCSKSKKGLNENGEEILLFERDGKVQGWIHYYFIVSDKYLGLNSMLIEKGFGEALEELFRYWKERYAGFSWCFYLPSDNTEAFEFMRKSGFAVTSRDTVDVLLFEDYISGRVSKNVITVDGTNFELFENLHSRCDNEMYWTSERIKNDLDRWRIFAYVEEGKCLGVLYYVCVGKDFEIFGIDYAEEKCDSEVTEQLLIGGLNRAKEAGAESMYFFDDDDTRVIAENLGFKRITEAWCFEGKL